MELGNRELEKIGEYVKSHLEEWMQPIRAQHELNLIERAIRVEEELKNLREQGNLQFKAIEKRFEAQQQYMDKRFKNLQWFMGIGFTLLAVLMGLLDIF